jgi:hypothetical protein
VTVAFEAAPVSSTSGSAVARVAPVALFQFDFGTTPALSPAAMAVPVPTKWMPTARAELAAPTESATVEL